MGFSTKSLCKVFRSLRLTASGWCLACAALPALAQSNGTDGMAAEAVAGTVANTSASSLELEKVDPAVDDPTGTTARLYRLDPTPQAQPSQELRTRWWLGNGIGSVGVGADWAAAPVGSPLRPWRPVLGLRADVSPQTRLIYEVRGPASSLADARLAGASDPEVRWALEFKSARNPAQNLRNGLFRVQLSNTSALFLRPRGGGMVVSYRSQF